MIGLDAQTMRDILWGDVALKKRLGNGPFCSSEISFVEVTKGMTKKQREVAQECFNSLFLCPLTTRAVQKAYDVHRRRDVSFEEALEIASFACYGIEKIISKKKQFQSLKEVEIINLHSA